MFVRVSRFCALWLISSPVSLAQETASAPTRLPPGLTPEARTAIDRGLAFLARTQDRQGFWSNRSGYGEYPVAMTALAGMALLMDGNTTTQGRYAPNVDRATTYLLRSVTPNGLIGRREIAEGRPMFGHGFSMLYLSQVMGVCEDASRATEIQEALRRAVQLTGRSQSRLGGWIYSPDSGGDEGSVTITQVQGLRSCRNMGVEVPKTIIDRAMEYLAISQNSDGGIRYMAGQQGGPSRVPISAAAVACWYNAGEYDNPRAKKALEFCKSKLFGNRPEQGHDYYAHVYWAQSLFVSSDKDWDDYFAKRRDYLLAQQQADGSWWGDGVGDVYGTALALIILQLPYNQLPIMQR